MDGEAFATIVERNLLELMTTFDTLKAEPRTYTLALDDIIHTTTAKYVTESTSGFLPNAAVPAHKCIEAMAALMKASRAEDPAEQLAMVVQAQELVEKAEWSGFSPAEGKLKADFVQLRTDKDASNPKLYNMKLGQIYDNGGALFMGVRGQGKLALENIYAAIPKLSMAASVAFDVPYEYKPEEQSEAFMAAKKMISYAKFKLGGGR